MSPAAQRGVTGDDARRDKGGGLMTSRQQLLATTFVALADTLVADFDVIDFLYTLATRSVELLDADAAGIMLADPHGGLHVMASSTEEARLLELYELQNNEGPCLDCYRSGRPVARDDLPAMRTAWPAFTEELQALGFHAAQALPMRLRDRTIGALNLFRLEPGRLTETDLEIGQAMADVATVGLIQERAIAASELLATQLQTALHSRVQIEQAKGVLAERTRLPMDQAFRLMRDYARSHNRRLSDVAAQITNGLLDDTILGDGRRGGPVTPLPT
jgi:transcriptional regulator with GAF, ATPase, and Fis domain